MMVTEALARLEARLCGGIARPNPDIPDVPWSIWLNNDCEVRPAADPADANGREWWCEALKMDVVAFLDIDGNVTDWHAYPWQGNNSGLAKSRTAAIIAAIEAAALAAASETEGNDA